MEWLSQNWVWVLFVAGMIAMHMFGHGGHGGRGGHGGSQVGEAIDVGRLHYTGKDKRLIRPDPQIVFAYDVSNLEDGQLAK